AQLIRINEQMINGFGLNQGFDAWMEYQKQMEERFRQFQSLQALYSPLSAWNPMAFSKPEASGKAPSVQPGRPESAAGELRELVKTLQEEVASLKKSSKKTKRKPK